MRPASKSDSADVDTAPGDFLRRLSVADAKVLLERTRKEKDAKTMEMQKMIGVRYRDLIDSADKIVSMHSAAIRLESSLKEMPSKWKDMETTLVATLSTSEKLLSTAAHDHSPVEQVETSSSASVHERVLFVVTAHEKLWFHLDRGESDKALALYHKAKTNYDSEPVQASIAMYPFLPSMWASVHSFEQRVKAVAESCLASRGKDALFYTGNLNAIAELDNTHDPDQLVEQFLRSRTQWLEFDDPGQSEEDDLDPAQALAARERQMRLNLRSLLQTIIHAQEIFLPSTTVSSSSVTQQSGLRCSSDLSDATTARQITQTIQEWFVKSVEDVSSHASATISAIPTIAKIAQTQAKLAAIETIHGSYRSTSLWEFLQGESHTVVITSMFELLFGHSLRKRTRDLVQHSFVDATTAIKAEIRASLSGVSEATKSIRHLPNVKFYEHFDGIHRKVAGLKSSELQRVLVEEYMRTLVSVVNFLETEYPWSQSPDGSSWSSSNPSYLLCLANILVSIVSQFPERQHTIFGDQESSTCTSTPSLLEDQKTFDAYAQNSTLTGTKLKALFKEVSTYSTLGSLFIDEDMHHLDAVGFFTFHLLSQIKTATTFEPVFVSVLRGLAQKYCEAWARLLLGQKISPLRTFLHVEQYDLTNEEWIASHQGWSEHVIIDDDASADDGDASGEDLSAAGEKVWLPWCETPTVSSFLFSCCYALDEAYRLVRTASGVSPSHVDAMHDVIRSVLTEQLTIMSVDVYEEAVDLVAQAKQSQSRAVLNFGEFCMLQFLFDMYFVRATLGFSDFVRFGWGDEIDLVTCAPSVARLLKLFERMHDFVDPVDWEIYGPQLIENVVVQFRKSRLLFSSLSEASDISEINGKPIVVSAQDTRPIIKLVEPVPRFSLLPVPTRRRQSPTPSQLAAAANGHQASIGNGDSLFHENHSTPSPPALKLQDLLSSAANSNILSAATSGTNLLSSAAKGMSFLSSATSSYLREGGTASAPSGSDGNRSKYF